MRIYPLVRIDFARLEMVLPGNKVLLIAVYLPLVQDAFDLAPIFLAATRLLRVPLFGVRASSLAWHARVLGVA